MIMQLKASVQGSGETPRNPACTSALLASVFPPGVATAELRQAGDPRLLLSGEGAHLIRAMPKRIQEFAAGRLCARHALSELGFVDFTVIAGSDRRPQWPSSIVGSITHTYGFSGAVVAERRRFRAIGVDAEAIVSVVPELWPHICTPAEASWLDALPETDRGKFAALIFSAKEAFYKCQYGVTGQWLEFHDIALAFHSNDLHSGSFSVRSVKGIRLLQHETMPFIGRFQFHEDLVVTGMVIEKI